MPDLEVGKFVEILDDADTKNGSAPPPTLGHVAQPTAGQLLK
jgi:hypothetical protein